MRQSILTLATILSALFCSTLDTSAFVDDKAPCDVAAWKAAPKDLLFAWGSRDTLLRRHDAPIGVDERAPLVLHGWRGERVGAEAVLYARTAIDEPVIVRCTTDKQLLAEAGFLRYVWTDDFRGCGDHPEGLPAWGVPDCISCPDEALTVHDMECRPIWVSVEIPQSAKAGGHTLKLQLVGAKSGKVLATLCTQVQVDKRCLPAPHEYAFHLDFWQQPYSVARYYQVKPWSQAHLDLLRPYMKRLARAGQKVVSAILFYEPWGRQSNDKFEPMIETTLRRDGTYSYDYSVFDKWVKLCAECGIDEQINCYSMVPWDMSFRYLDEATGQFKYLNTTTSTEEYKTLWTSFLQSFAKHLREVGLFDKTCIAMDERGEQDMMNAYHVVKQAVPDFKMSLAGNMHRNLVSILHDYCLPIGAAYTKDGNYGFSQEDLDRRRAQGQFSTIYTCCTEANPNILSNSVPQEAALLPLAATLLGYDGYLHWAWLNWTDNPLVDTRFKYFSPGDTYIIYPGNRSSVRWERFVEGVQQSEKCRTLSADVREELKELIQNTDVSNATAVAKVLEEVQRKL